LFSRRSIFGVDPSGARRHCCNGKRGAILKFLKEQGIWLQLVLNLQDFLLGKEKELEMA
jgi:hypothetical protein